MAQIHPFIADEPTLDRFIADWQACQLAKSCWTHAAHIGTAAYFAFDHEPAALLVLMRTGISRFNESVGGKNTEDAGYHETITRFWCNVITKFAREHQPCSRFALVCKAVDAFGESRDFHGKYYSFDVIKDRRARREWVAPDLPAGFVDVCEDND